MTFVSGTGAALAGQATGDVAEREFLGSSGARAHHHDDAGLLQHLLGAFAHAAGDDHPHALADQPTRQDARLMLGRR